MGLARQPVMGIFAGKSGIPASSKTLKLAPSFVGLEPLWGVERAREANKTIQKKPRRCMLNIWRVDQSGGSE